MSDLQVFPPLDAATELALRESIRRFGVLVPVVVDQYGRTLDGHHRTRIAGEEGVKHRVDVVRVDSDEQAREIAATLNTDRRQLDAAQRREIVAVLREAGHSRPAIASALGVDEKTVRNDLSGSDHSEPDRVVGKDGKTYPARRPTIIAAKDPREAGRAQDALATADVPAGRVLDVKRTERIAREQAAERRRSEPIDDLVTDDVTILHGDFREVLMEHDLVGATVITDPPYPREFLPLWGELAEVALATGCEQLVAMSGQSYLPEVIERVLGVSADAPTHDIPAKRWRYRWMCSYLTIGPATRIHHAAVGTSWKPIIVFDQEYDREFVTIDVFRSTGDDKNHHYWGQNENGVAQLVEAFTKPGDTVLDPFLGGGTTAVVCKALGRRFIGCDVDAAAVGATLTRLAA